MTDNLTCDVCGGKLVIRHAGITPDQLKLGPHKPRFSMQATEELRAALRTQATGAAYQAGRNIALADALELLIKSAEQIERIHILPHGLSPRFGGQLTQAKEVLEKYSIKEKADPMKIEINEAELATILAALRYYQEENQGEPSERSDRIHTIATNFDAQVSLDADGIDTLCERINVYGVHDDDSNRPAKTNIAVAAAIENMELVFDEVCETCNHTKDEHKSDGEIGECWHGSSSGNTCPCAQFEGADEEDDEEEEEDASAS